MTQSNTMNLVMIHYTICVTFNQNLLYYDKESILVIYSQYFNQLTIIFFKKKCYYKLIKRLEKSAYKFIEYIRTFKIHLIINFLIFGLSIRKY